MSFSIRMTVGGALSASNSPSEYRVQRRDGCTLIFGSIPVDDFVSFTKKQAKDVMVSGHLAHVAGCNMAMGTDAQIDALMKVLEPEALARGKLRYATTGLSEDAIRWLSIGNRGSSSNAMFFMLTGVNPGDIDPMYLCAHPGDIGDFYLCRMLLEAVPELVPNLPRMADASAEWAIFVQHWSALCGQMDAETPTWRDGRSRSPITNKMVMVVADLVRTDRARRSKSDVPEGAL